MDETTKQAEAWDLEAVYDAEISPLMVKIIEICKREKLPMVASFAYASDGEGGTDYCTTALLVRPDEKLEEAARVIAPRRRAPPLQITEMHADGSKTVTVILGD